MMMMTTTIPAEKKALAQLRTLSIGLSSVAPSCNVGKTSVCCTYTTPIGIYTDAFKAREVVQWLHVAVKKEPGNGASVSSYRLWERTDIRIASTTCVLATFHVRPCEPVPALNSTDEGMY